MQCRTLRSVFYKFENIAKYPMGGFIQESFFKKEYKNLRSFNFRLRSILYGFYINKISKEILKKQIKDALLLEQ